MRLFRRLAHLVRRVATTMKGRTPSRTDLQWAAELLAPPELTLFSSMEPIDQAHALEVARRTEALLGQHGGDTNWVLVAALLHDVGKIESEAGVAGRVLATLIGPAVGDSMAERLGRQSGWRGSVGRYLRYPILGASLLGAIGSDERVRAWAAEHHRPADEWSVPSELGRVLRDADDASS